MRCEHCIDASVLDCPDCRKNQVIGSTGEGYIIKCCQCRQKKPMAMPKAQPIGQSWGGAVPVDKRGDE